MPVTRSPASRAPLPRGAIVTRDAREAEALRDLRARHPDRPRAVRVVGRAVPAAVVDGLEVADAVRPVDVLPVLGEAAHRRRVHRGDAATAAVDDHLPGVASTARPQCGRSRSTPCPAPVDLVGGRRRQPVGAVRRLRRQVGAGGDDLRAQRLLRPARRHLGEAVRGTSGRGAAAGGDDQLRDGDRPPVPTNRAWSQRVRRSALARIEPGRNARTRTTVPVCDAGQRRPSAPRPLARRWSRTERRRRRGGRRSTSSRAAGRRRRSTARCRTRRAGWPGRRGRAARAAPARSS
jgi:hypothetical protein